MSSDNPTVDVAIAGAGFTGLAAALELARRGLRVVVVEKDSEAGGLAGSFRVADKGGEALFEGHYPIPYERATPASITDIMHRVLAHADLAEQTTVTDKKTKQAITDFTAPNPNAYASPGGYPTGVLLAGALAAADATGDKSFSDFTAKHFQFISDHLAYFTAMARANGSTKGNPFRNFIEPTSLDSCGAWGAAMVQARRMNVGPDLKGVIDLYADYVEHKQFRLSDGTLARTSPQPDSLWADDMYMSIPLLAQMGKLTGDPAYYDDAVKQVLQISDRLFIWNKGLFAHGWSAGNADYNPEFHWGRANGWCLVAMCKLLDVLPPDHPGRDKILKIMRTMIKSLAPLQSDRGLWHQLLDHEDSYLETSCTAMFTYSIAHAINQGWISAASYGPVAQAAWTGITTKVGEDGSVNGTCVGTNYASVTAFYYARPAKDDVHGYGPVLLAGSEMIKLYNNPKISVKYGSGVYVYTSKE